MTPRTSMTTILACVSFLIVGRTAMAQPTKNDVCASAEYHQFDFWIGDWEVFDNGGKTRVAEVRVNRLLDGCVLQEYYQDPTGLKGESLSSYDALTHDWQQTWITNRGQLLVIRGQLQNGEMVFSGSSDAPTGHMLVRATWKPAGATVRETAETSKDNGKTWQPWFDLVFRRR